MSYKNIDFNSFINKPLQYHWVVEDIKAKIAEGVNPDSIAIIARKHKSLEQISRFFLDANIPINYEKQENVLENVLIIELINITKFCYSLFKYDIATQENLLPEILNYGFWNNDSYINYKLSLLIQGKNKPLEAKILEDNDIERIPKSWFETALLFPDDKINKLTRFLLDISQAMASSSAEEILDYIIGNTELNGFNSPYKQFYFSDVTSQHYLGFLNSLQVFMAKYRDSQTEGVNNIERFVEFVELHQSNKISINATTPKAENDAVNLITAHKSKGLEFERVYLINANQDEWFGKGYNSKLKLPINLPFEAGKDDIDDKLRLLFVAITRSEKYLVVSNFQKELSGSLVAPINYFSEIEQASIDNHNKLSQALETFSKNEETIVIDHNLKEELEPVLRKYQLSVTHLNNFLDLTNGGPYRFLEQNLLMFPQAKALSVSFGTAIHACLNQFYIQYKQENKLPDLNSLKKHYQNCLRREKLNSKDHKNLLEKGYHNLEIYYTRKNGDFDISDVLEKNFKSQGCVIGEARLKGAIDKMSIDTKEKEVLVIDYKTGKTFSNFDEKGSVYKKLKKAGYKRQILFYKLLVENSRDYLGFRVNHGQIEFLENIDKIDDNIIQLEINNQDVQDLRVLVQAVYKKIVNLDFPKVEELEHYQNKKGEFDFQSVKDFTQDIIDQKI